MTMRFQNLNKFSPLDVHDDVFTNGDQYRMWEKNKLAAEKDMIILDFASWTNKIHQIGILILLKKVNIFQLDSENFCTNQCPHNLKSC